MEWRPHCQMYIHIRRGGLGKHACQCLYYIVQRFPSLKTTEDKDNDSLNLPNRFNHPRISMFLSPLQRFIPVKEHGNRLKGGLISHHMILGLKVRLIEVNRCLLRLLRFAHRNHILESIG